MTDEAMTFGLTAKKDPKHPSAIWINPELRADVDADGTLKNKKRL